MKPPVKYMIDFACIEQGFHLMPTGRWWNDETKECSPLGIMARSMGIQLGNPYGNHDPVWAFCKARWGHPTTEAVMRGFEGHPPRGELVCATIWHRLDYEAGYRLGQECREAALSGAMQLTQETP